MAPACEVTISWSSRAGVDETDVVVCRDAGGKPVGDELREDGPAPFLAVVMRAGAAREEAEALHGGQLGPERIGDAVLEPADHPGAPAGEQHSALPRFAQDRVESVCAPNGDRVGRVASGDEDDVVVEHELAQVRRRPGKEVEDETSAPGPTAVVPLSVQAGSSIPAVGT